MEYTINHIPPNTPNNRRPRIKMVPEFITIHNTGNPTSTAKNERAWLTNPSNNVTASYHIVVDDKEAIEVMSLSEVAWHAGDGNGKGNRASIGIEICESGNYAKALENAVELVAKLLHERTWGVDKLRRHYDWSGKICPRKMYDAHKKSWAKWEAFKVQVNNKLIELKTTKQTKIGKATISVQGKIIDGIIIDSVSYAPVRPLVEALGKQVSWDANTKVVTIK